MTDPAAINRHYGDHGLLEVTKSALSAHGLGFGTIHWSDLVTFDQFHTGGIEATKELASRIQIEPGMSVLDVGSGLGGPTRFLASTYDCQVTGLDLNPEYNRIATYLSERTGLEHQTEFLTGSALEMPFPDASFDLAWTQHVAMNIADRDTLYREIRRVLKPGGQLAIHDVVLGGGGPMLFPVPWASTPDLSAVVSVDAMKLALNGAGFSESVWVDTSESTSQWFAARKAMTQPGASTQLVGNITILGPDFPERLKNLARNAMEDRVRFVQTVQTAT